MAEAMPVWARPEVTRTASHVEALYRGVHFARCNSITTVETAIWWRGKYPIVSGPARSFTYWVIPWKPEAAGGRRWVIGEGGLGCWCCEKGRNLGGPRGMFYLSLSKWRMAQGILILPSSKRNYKVLHSKVAWQRLSFPHLLMVAGSTGL